MTYFIVAFVVAVCIFYIGFLWGCEKTAEEYHELYLDHAKHRNKLIEIIDQLMEEKIK